MLLECTSSGIPRVENIFFKTFMIASDVLFFIFSFSNHLEDILLQDKNVHHIQECHLLPFQRELSEILKYLEGP